MSNARPAPLELALEVKRRLEKANPGALLTTEAVKLVAIPGVPFDATVFCFVQDRKCVLVAELAHPGLPHIYNSAEVIPGQAKQSAGALVKALLGLAHTIKTDPRFRRNIITLPGSAHNGSGKIIVPKGMRIRS
ncbi:MAG: hypothetical protein LC642_04680 [Verrucomicrobiaceae bacterium]|nr:hypothetical protein [Verrucomicrobiaceae bacterium]